MMAPEVFGWHTPVHNLITGAALQSLPARLRAFWEPEAANLVNKYCIYPDMYHNAAPAVRDTMRLYCETASGKVIHNVSLKREEDLALAEHVINGIAESVRNGNPNRAAQFAGVLAHLVEDSTCPAHALYGIDTQLELLKDLAPPPPDKRSLRLHTIIEESAPHFDLGSRVPEVLGTTPTSIAERMLDRIYATVRFNRGQLLEVAQAVYVNDETTMNRHRLEAARTGAHILADALYSSQLLATANSK